MEEEVAARDVVASDRLRTQQMLRLKNKLSILCTPKDGDYWALNLSPTMYAASLSN